MRKNIGKTQSLVWIQGNHRNEKVLEALTEEIFFMGPSVPLPEQVLSIASEDLVKVVTISGLVPWSFFAVNHEQDYGQGKEVSLIALVLFFHENLWRHVLFRARISDLPAITKTASHVVCESEVDELQITLSSDHYVLHLDIPMACAVVVQV